MVANTKGLKRKSLAPPQNTSPKKTPKVTSISASNTPAKLKKLSSPIQKNIPAKPKNIMIQSNKGAAKQKKAPPKVEQSDDDDEDEEENASDSEELEMEDDSDMEDADSIGIEEEDDSVDGEEDSDNENVMDNDDTGDNSADDDDDNDDDDSDSNEVEEKPIVKVEKTKKQDDKKKRSTWERVSKDDQFVLFVGHLNFKTSEDEVRQYFRKAGPVEGVNLAKFRNDASRGFGFIQMKDDAGFKKALKLNHTSLGGMQINVEVAKKSSLEKAAKKPQVRSKKNKKPAEA